MKDKDLQYYLGLKYDVIVREVEDEGGIDYKAFTRELSPDAFYGIGSTPAEAVESFNEVKEELFPYYLENDLAIPEPEPEPELLPSGRFVIRTSPKTHQALIRLADRNQQSLNAYVNSIFERVATAGDLTASFTEYFQEAVLECMTAVQTKWDFQFGKQFAPQYSPRPKRSYEEAA